MVVVQADKASVANTARSGRDIRQFIAVMLISFNDWFHKVSRHNDMRQKSDLKSDQRPWGVKNPEMKIAFGSMV